jgi:hypothetical protein
VTFRCTGSPTSTFGAGGGTKLFCSQALDATHANMTKKLRDMATACCEREGVIAVPRCFRKRMGSEESFRHPSIPTILLQWNRKPKMMPAAKIFLISAFEIFSFKAAAAATRIRIS